MSTEEKNNWVVRDKQSGRVVSDHPMTETEAKQAQTHLTESVAGPTEVVQILAG